MSAGERKKWPESRGIGLGIGPLNGARIDKAEKGS
jgi:hypothetical protein